MGENKMTTTTATPEALAAKFSELLRAQFTRKQMAAVISRNRRETNDKVCHSHDFCDANVVMDEAFKQVLGYSATDTGIGDGTQQSGGCMSDECLDLWNAAWAIAKKSEFKKEED